MPNKNWLSEKDYDFIYTRVPRLCVDLVIKTPEGILLTKRDIEPYKGHWHLPGGRVLFRESLANAATRIVKKELGVNVKLGKMLGTVELPREVQHGSMRHSVSVVFFAEITSGKIKIDSQTQEVNFFKKIPKPTAGPHANFLLEKKLFR